MVYKFTPPQQIQAPVMNTPDYVGRAVQQFQQGQLMGQQKHIKDLTGRALMGADPEAMQELARLDPNAAIAVQQQHAAQTKAQRDRLIQDETRAIERAKLVAEMQDKYSKAMARATNIEQAQVIHEQYMKNPLFAKLMGKQVAQDADDLRQDHMASRILHGTGFGDMEIKDVKASYDSAPVVKQYSGTMYTSKMVNNLLDQGSAEADAQAVKMVIKLVDSGVVTDSDISQATNRGYHNVQAFENLLGSWEKGTLTDTSRKQFREIVNNLSSIKKQGVADLQGRISPLLSQHDPNVVFANTGIVGVTDDGAVLLDDGAEEDVPVTPPMNTQGWILEKDKVTGVKAYVNPNDRTQYEVVE